MNERNLWILMIAAFWLVVALPPVAHAETKDAAAIMGEMMGRNILGFEKGRAEVRIILYDRSGERRERKLDVFGEKSEEEIRMVMVLREPAEVRGQSFLVVENAAGPDEFWMYVPAFDIIGTVEGTRRRNAFLGSHFKIADLDRFDLREANYRRLEDELIAEEEVYVIEMQPTNEQEREYEKVVAYIRKSDHMAIRIRYFNTEGELEKTMEVEKFAATEEGVVYVERMKIRAASGGNTTVEVKGLDAHAERPEFIFDQE